MKPRTRFTAILLCLCFIFVPVKPAKPFGILGIALGIAVVTVGGVVVYNLVKQAKKERKPRWDTNLVSEASQVINFKTQEEADEFIHNLYASMDQEAPMGSAPVNLEFSEDLVHWEPTATPIGSAEDWFLIVTNPPQTGFYRIGL